LDQIVEDAFPDAAARPAHEAHMDALVLAIAVRQIAPPRPGTQHPEHPVDELTVVRRRPPHMLQPPRKRVLDTLPLHIAQLISARHNISAANQNSTAKSICGYALAEALEPRTSNTAGFSIKRWT